MHFVANKNLGGEGRETKYVKHVTSVIQCSVTNNRKVQN